MGKLRASLNLFAQSFWIWRRGSVRQGQKDLGHASFTQMYREEVVWSMPFRMCVRSQYCTFVRFLYRDIANNIVYIYIYINITYRLMMISCCCNSLQTYNGRVWGQKNLQTLKQTTALAQTSVLKLFQILTFVTFTSPDDLQAEAASRFKMLLLRCKKCRRKNASTEHPPVRAEGGMLAKIIGTLDLQLQPASSRCNSQCKKWPE